MAIQLPTVKSKIKSVYPKNLIMFGLPKVGKTTLLSNLPRCLIVDMEDGTDYVEALSIKAKTYVDLFNIAKELKANPGQFEFVALDTVTALEEMALPYANKLYRETSMGVNFDPNENILKLPNGAGYLYAREAVQKIIGWFTSVVPNVLLVGHVKEKSYNEEGTDLNVKDLDLVGKLGRILSASSDAICYIYRDVETGEVRGNFGDDNSVLTGARMPHLSGKTVVLSRKDKETGKIETFWENIYVGIND